MQNKPRQSISQDVLTVVRGVLMGGADIIPGVSGGTVALIVGIYERLVTAISQFDLQLLGLLRKRAWREAAEHIDLRFLVTLGFGILTGIASLATLTNFLLLNYQPQTLSLFFGLILASSFLVGRMVQRWSISSIGLLIAGAAFAYWLVGQLPAVPPSGSWYLFLCGAIAICAMILPGISGAFIMVIMGMYADVTGAISTVTRGEATVETFLTLGIFAMGCGLGLLSFSKILRWLLARHEAATMATLCGFMFGSLRKIWPFKNDVSLEYLTAFGLSDDKVAAIRDNPERINEFVKAKRRIFENTLPEAFDASTATCLGIVLVGIILVFALDRVSNVSGDTHPLEDK
jgi:putative membrane protein